MKKVLFGTTALVGAALLASAAQAEGPKVTVGGFYDFAAAWTNDKSTTLSADNQRAYGFRNDTEVDFKIDGVADTGLKYGAEISLEADVASSGASPYSANNQGFHASKTYGYLEGSWGRTEMGSNVGADQTLKVDGTTNARATGGIGGIATFFWNTPSHQFITSPDLPINYGQTNSGDQSQQNITKVTYYTPRFQGLQAGLSYAPDATDRGQIVDRSKLGGVFKTAYGNVFQGGVNYDNTFSGVGVAASLTGEYAKHDTNNTLQNIRSYAAGAKLSYLGFALAGSYGDWRHSEVAAGKGTGNFYDATLSYENGAYGASLGYIKSKVADASAAGKNTFKNIVAGVDYKLAPGITPYVEADFYKFDGVGGAGVNDNKSTLVIVGSQLAF